MKCPPATIVLALSSCLAGVSCQSAGTGSAEVDESYVNTEDGTLLYYRKIGSGPEVLVVPEASWVDADMTRLTRGRTVIFYDPRGRGRSDGTRVFRFDQDVRDLEAIRSWFGLERFDLMSTHAGAVLAALYAAEHPERVDKLVLVSPSPVRKEPYWPIYERVFNERRDEEAIQNLLEMRKKFEDRRDPEGWAKAYKEMLFTGWVINASAVDGMKSNPFVEPNNDPERQVAKYLGMFRDLGDWDWRDDLRTVRSPTLIVYGEKDPVPRPSFVEWEKSIRGARSHVVDGSARLPWIERPRDFYGAVEDFLGE